MKAYIIRELACAIMTFLQLVMIHAQQSTDGHYLNEKQQKIALIAAFTANGDLSSLSAAIWDGLDAGLTVNEIKEVITQLYAYAGFPRSLNSLNTALSVVKLRKSKGIVDELGKDASPFSTEKSKIALGTENQTRLVGSPVKGEVYEFAPVIDQFLKEHLFGDIFGRDILDFQTREIVTISALVCLGGAENQLRSHFRVGMHNGLTKDQLYAIVQLIRSGVGEMEANKATEVLLSVLETDPSEPKQTPQSSNFVGTVSVKMMVTPDSVFNMQMASVTFAAGARTNWHYHPSGQILLITDGKAYFQEKGKPRKTLSRGEIVKCPPNVHHWHGASPQGSMTHIALTPDLEKGGVVWLGQVTPEEYGDVKK